MNIEVGVGPHPKPWPNDERFDEQLLANGDQRNVVDKYRYWTVEAIKKDLDASRQPVEIAIENYQHDFNIGTIVRNANAFNVSAVHIIGRKNWNRRGAMVTDMYMHVFYHASTADFIQSMKERARTLVGIDIVPSAIDITHAELPENIVMIFGAEGPGLSEEMQENCSQIVKIEQIGSTRSINVGVASGIALYEWTKRCN